jgi:hypoxanthine-guanine phosphoribosyltransferase
MTWNKFSSFGVCHICVLAVTMYFVRNLLHLVAVQSELDTLAATLKQLENQKGEAQKRLNDLKGQVTCRVYTVWHWLSMHCLALCCSLMLHVQYHH